MRGVAESLVLPPQGRSPATSQPQAKEGCGGPSGAGRRHGPPILGPGRSRCHIRASSFGARASRASKRLRVRAGSTVLGRKLPRGSPRSGRPLPYCSHMRASSLPEAARSRPGPSAAPSEAGLRPDLMYSRIPHLAQTSDAVNRQLSCFSSRYMNLLAVFQI